MSGFEAASTTLLANDVLATWWNLPRAVEVDGVLFYAGMTAAGRHKVVELG